MQINNVGRARQIEELKKKKKAGTISGSEFSEMLEALESSEDTAPTESTAQVGGLDALLAVQAGSQDEEFRQKQRQSVDHAELILDKLETLRRDILLGNLSQTRLSEIAHSLQLHGGFPDDPKLDKLLKDVSLRAQVELAKFDQT